MQIVLYSNSDTAILPFDHTKMTETAARPTAKIYQFTARPRSPAKSAAAAAKLTSFPWESGWYHGEAIDEAHIKPVAGPAG